MKTIVGLLILVYILAVGYNVYYVQDNSEVIEKDATSISIEVASRLGIGKTLVILGSLLSGDTNSILNDERTVREFLNVVYDWYAPIKFSPVLNVSKEIGWLLFKQNM